MSFGIANNVKSEVRACTPDLLMDALNAPRVARICAEIVDAFEAYLRGETTHEEFETRKNDLKKLLPIITPHATFKKNRRKNEDAIPSGLCMYDLDHIENPAGRWEEIEPRQKELGIVMAHITPSTKGLRLIFIIPDGMSLEEAQAWMASQLGDKVYDACVKDYARCSYVPPMEYVLFLDADALFAERIQPTPATSPSTEKEDNPVELLAPSGENNYPQTFKNIPYPTIIAEWFLRNGGEPETGERNTKLHRLASHLRYITDNNEEHLLQVMPRYGLKEDEMKTLIHSACIAKFYGMPRSLKKLLADLEKSSETESTGLENPNPDEDMLPKMPNRLPPLIKLLVSRTPKIYRAAVAHAVFPALATHLWKTYFRYIDNVEHEATLMCCLMAGTGAGKNCISEPINRIMKDIRKQDAENLLREKEWKKEMQTRGANKDKRQRPEGLVVQEIDPDMTNAAFVQRLADAEERFLYTRMNEIDQFDALKTSARSKAHFQIMCLAFDPGNVYGQTRVGTSSVSERVCIRFNWNASTTIRKGQAYFQNVLTDGPVSRINFCSIPEQPIGADIPVYGTYDAEFDEELRPYIERLTKARGLVECNGARNLAKKLREECAEFARLSQSRVYENLSFRANVIAFLKAMVLFVAQGGVWDKVTEEFIRWSLRYDMACKMRFFGEAIELQEEGTKPKNKGPQNLLDLLPDVFTREEARQMRQRQGVKKGNVQSMLDNWKNRGYIRLKGEARPDDMGTQQFEKTEAYLKKHPKSFTLSVFQ